MIRTFTVAILFFLSTGFGIYAQPFIPKDVKPLYKLLAESKADTARVNLLIKIGRYDNANSANQPALLDSALATANRAAQLSAKLSYPEGLGLANQVMAQSWCYKKDFKKCDELIKKAVALFLKNNLYRDAAEAYLNMEEFYLSGGGHDYNVMIEFYEQAAPLFHQVGAWEREGATLTILGDFYQVSRQNQKALERLNAALIAYGKTNYRNLQYLYDLLGHVYKRESRYNEALKYGLLAVKTAEIVGDTSLLLCTIYNRLGTTYFLVNKPELAKNYFQKSLAIAQKYKHIPSIRLLVGRMVNVLSSENKPEEAIKMLIENRKNFPSNDSYSLKEDYSTFISLYSSAHQYKNAQLYVDSLIATGALNQNNEITAFTLDAITQFYIESGQYDKASKYLPQFREITGRILSLRAEYRAYLRSFMVDSAHKNYLPAIKYYQRYVFLKDSLYDIDKTKQLEELKIRYETDQKERSIISLKKDSLLQHTKAKQADDVRNLTLIATVILFVLICALYYSFRLNKKNNEKLDEKNKSLNQLVIEKEWLIKEIHHRVKNNLQIVMGLLQRQSAYIDNQDALAAIQSSENRMRSIALIHQKLYQSENLDLIFMPEYIDEMISYLKDSCALENRIFFEKQIDSIHLDVAQAVPLGLILNEAITNAIKYAYPADADGIIYISMIKTEKEQIELTIADNGPGLPPGFDINKVDSLGVNLMKGLSKQLAGTFDMTNEQGCMIHICFKAETFLGDRATDRITLT